MSEMVERVATAIGHGLACGYDMRWSTEYRANCCCGALTKARAAISAMREMTPEMYEALSNTGKLWREMDSREVYTTLIDGALAEEPSKEETAVFSGVSG